MVTTTALSHKTELNDRTLWYDGSSTFKASTIFDRLGKYDVKFVDELTPTITEYNRSVGAANKLAIKETVEPLDHTWIMPDRYKKLNLIEYFSQAHAILVEGMDDVEIEQREIRLAKELKRYRQLGLDDVLKTLIWIMNELTKQDVVWGIGRGSSVSSYALYLIGVHDVDSFAYQLDVDDFLRE